MTMGFGSWAGAFFGLEGGLCLWVILFAFCTGAICGGVIALGMMAVRRQFHDNLQHTRAIMMDLITTGSISLIAEKAQQRRPRWHRLPYGVPLCIGFVGYLWLAGLVPQDSPKPTEKEHGVLSAVSQAASITSFTSPDRA